MLVPSEPRTGPRCPCGCPYLRGLVLLRLVLTAYGGAFAHVGPAVRDVPVESLTCEACARETLTRDLPPIGVDVVAVLEHLAERGPTDRPVVRRQAVVPACPCGARALSWSSVVAITVHVAGGSLLGEVVSSDPIAVDPQTLSCGACSRSWAGDHSHLPGQVRDAIGAFRNALLCGKVGSDQ